MRLQTAFSAGVLLLTSFLTTPTTANEVLESLRTHSLYVPYIDDELRMRYWDFGGNAVINTSKHIRLTYEKQSMAGWLWSKLPLPDAAWQVEFEFKVHGESSHIFGDGFAFWATKGRATGGPVFGNQDFFEGVGIFFDTYMNGNTDHYFPYIPIMNGNGKINYDHDMDGKKNELGGCEVDFRNHEHPTKARVTYYKANSLRLDIQWQEDKAWMHCFTVYDITLPKPAYLGFTAMTGEVSDNHDIVTVTSNEITSPPPPKPAGVGQNFGGSHVLSGHHGMGSFLKLILLAGVCGLAFVGYRMFQQQGNRRF